MPTPTLVAMWDWESGFGQISQFPSRGNKSNSSQLSNAHCREFQNKAQMTQKQNSSNKRNPKEIIAIVHHITTFWNSRMHLTQNCLYFETRNLILNPSNMALWLWRHCLKLTPITKKKEILVHSTAQWSRCQLKVA